MDGSAEPGDERPFEVPDGLYEVVVEAAPTGLIVLDEEGVITWTNDVYADTLGVPRADLVGTHFPELVAAGYYDERVTEEYADHLRDLLSSDSDVDEARYQVRTYAPDGLRVHDVRLALWPTDDGEFRGTVVAFQDVTTQRAYERELERRNEQLEAFASVVSHDLRNPLNVAQGHLQRAMEGETDALSQVADAHDRMATLLEDLLALAREGQQVRDARSVDLDDLVGRAWRSVATPDADLVVGDVGSVEADPSRLQQAFENLFRNAVEHAGPDVSVTVGPLDDDPGFFVADDGPGVPPDEREHAFERGYSTADEGTGFGLAIVESIVEAHGWTVEVADADGGARFEVRTDPALSLDGD